MEGERQCKWTFISQSPSLREGIWGQRMTAVQQTCHVCFIRVGNRVISLTANFLSADHMPGALVSPLRTSSHLPQHPCEVHHNHPLVGEGKRGTGGLGKLPWSCQVPMQGGCFQTQPFWFLTICSSSEFLLFSGLFIKLVEI